MKMKMKLKTALTPLVGYFLGNLTAYTFFVTDFNFLVGSLLGAACGALLVYFAYNNEITKQNKLEDSK